MTGAIGRVALVTGASSGIGAATARLLAGRGMRVVVNYLRNTTAAEEVVAAIEAAGGQAMAVQADVREPAAIERMVEQVQAAWGGIDVLVHNALIPYAVKSFQDMTWEELGGKIDAEMHAAFAVAKAVLPAMRGQGWGRPDRDVHTAVRSPGDYGMDLRHLRNGSIDAAYVGSTMAPEAVAAEHGWQVPAWVGDHFQIPTVGVAVDPSYISPDDPAVQAVVRADRRALQVIHNDPDTTVRHMRTFLGGQTEEEVRAHYARFIAPYFTTDGHADLAVGDSAITAVSAELGVPATVTAAEFYRTATATPWFRIPLSAGHRLGFAPHVRTAWERGEGSRWPGGRDAQRGRDRVSRRAPAPPDRTRTRSPPRASGSARRAWSARSRRASSPSPESP